jgi:hypothetical protein
VGREVLQRQDIQRRQQQRAVAFFAREHREEGLQGFRQRLRLLVAVDHEDQRPARELPQQDRVHGLSRGGETRQAGAAALLDAADRFLKAGVLG